MRPDNTAVYECPKDKKKLHTWLRYPATGRAMCKKCHLQLTREQADEVFTDNEKPKT